MAEYTIYNIEQLKEMKLKKDLALTNYISNGIDNKLLLIWYEVDNWREINKDVFVRYLEYIKTNVRNQEKLIDGICDNFDDSCLIDKVTYAIAKGLIEKILSKFFNMNLYALDTEIDYMLEKYWFDDEGLVIFDNKKWVLKDFESWYVYLEEYYGKKEENKCE